MQQLMASPYDLFLLRGLFDEDEAEKIAGELTDAERQLLRLIKLDKIDRPPSAYYEGPYARSGKYFEVQDMIPKTGVYAEAGLCRAGAEFSIFEVEAKGPNARVSAEAGMSAIGEMKAEAMASAEVASASASAGPLEFEAKGPNASVSAGVGVSMSRGAEVDAMARAEIWSTSASVGPLKAKVGLGVDTGVSVNMNGMEARFLGTGFRVGSTSSISVLGSEWQF
ncbi:uncharacterized protein ACMZJ9_017889 [Mantella aurantiaca]